MFRAPNVTPDRDSFPQQVKNALLCCAIGDALGADVEIWSLEQIQAHYKNAENLFYARNIHPSYGCKTSGLAGDITDDTAMTACMMAALTKACDIEFSRFSQEEFIDNALVLIFDSFLYWGKSQKTYMGLSGEPSAKHLFDTNWPMLKLFTTTFGAGDGTIKILNHGIMGTLDKLPEKPPIDGKPEKNKYVAGCGALMRVMPVGLLCGQIAALDAFEFGCRTGALTHGDAASYLSAGIAAEIIANLISQPLSSLFETVQIVRRGVIARAQDDATTADKRAGYQSCIAAMDAALNSLTEEGSYPENTLDKIGYQVCKEDINKTHPVLAQALFVALAAEKHKYDADTALKMAAYQSGDSDSVAAIAGGILGVMGGQNAKITDQRLVGGLNQQYRVELNKLGAEFVNAVQLLNMCLQQSIKVRP